MTIKNMPGIDIVVTDKTAAKIIGIQVKAKQNTGKKKVWTLTDRDEKRISDNLFYVFVDLKMKKAEPAEFYVFTSREVAKRITKYNEEWEKEPGHNPNKIRSFILKDNEEPGNWSILLGPPGRTPTRQTRRTQSAGGRPEA
ncbi:MAG: hypothetical protein LBB68_10670 [Treponema sp.]|nr:hypothetical protein [Treponema sp.]